MTPPTAPFPIRTLCIYCGSSAGNSTVYADAARQLAAELASRSIGLVYGGGNIGLMGVVADEMLARGGSVTGVIPQALLDKEVGHAGLTRMEVVKDMHERKATMASLADGFIAMPGGIGTLEELFEALTWSQLGFHQKPVGLLNVDGFYDGLITFVDHLVITGFLRPEHASLLMHADHASRLLSHFETYRPEACPRVLDAATANAVLP